MSTYNKGGSYKYLKRLVGVFFLLQLRRCFLLLPLRFEPQGTEPLHRKPRLALLVEVQLRKPTANTSRRRQERTGCSLDRRNVRYWKQGRALR